MTHEHISNTCPNPAGEALGKRRATELTQDALATIRLFTLASRSRNAWSRSRESTRDHPFAELGPVHTLPTALASVDVAKIFSFPKESFGSQSEK
jgi:hypothetical protein